MSVNSFVDRRIPKFRETIDEKDSAPSVAAARVDRSEPGAWSEGLSPFGVGWELPGQGESGAGCGEWYPEAVCESCGEPSLAARVCGRRSCPECWGVWAKQASVRGARRIQAFRYTQPPNHRRQVAHAYVSPPEGEIMTERGFWAGKKRAAEIAEEKGWRGCAVVAHPSRVTEEGKKRYREEDPEYGIWVWLRNDVDDMEEYTYWSPHYHIVGVTGADMDPATEEDDWVYRFKRSLEGFAGVRDSKSHEDVYGLFRYLLSHTGYPEGSTKQAVTWYGALANNKFVEDATEDWQHQKPSPGVLSVLEREIEEVAGVEVDEEEGESGENAEESDDMGPCPEEDCSGVLIDVFDVPQYLRQHDPPSKVRRMMEVCLEWRLGEVVPPPGLQHPRTEEHAREALDAMKSRY